jgi:hypothetical protein
MNAEIAQYAAAVGAALADLPQNARDELMEDLPEHLAEVAAEAEAEGVGLADKLGPPATYAAELRASLGHEELQRRARWSDRRARLETRLQSLNVRAGHILGYARLTDLLRQLRPAWWVLRGYLAALIVGRALGDSEGQGVLPQFGGNGVIGFFLVIGGIIASVWLGGATVSGGRKTRVFSGALSTGIALYAVLAIVVVDGYLTRGGYSGDPFEYTSQYQPSDVVVVDTKGHPIGPVGIVDLNSQTYLDTTVHTCEGMLPWERERWPLLQALCRGTASPSPSPTVSSSPGVSPSVSPLPTPTR